ncbi:MAG TPA: glycogen debranching N-terminal domain-containing protein [Gaiellaceae bacterium]|nr:glycogen debranching N-terminal domain-containing protein [Gaiellaceae bacterium]
MLDGTAFCVSDVAGDVDATSDRLQGMFHRDTRFLSRWIPLTRARRRPGDIVVVRISLTGIRGRWQSADVVA